MSFPFVPQPPDWSIDWSQLDRLDWIRDLRGVPQHPIRHAEVDVWTHVHLVCEAMAASPEWRALSEVDRGVLFSAALLHDVAKAFCTRVTPEGDVTSRGHSWKGAIRTRQILWRRRVPFMLREQVAALVRHHLVPMYLYDSRDPTRLAIEVSQTARCDHLAILAEADARGRVCPDPQKLLDQISIFRGICEELNCFDRPYSFGSDQERFGFFYHPVPVPPVIGDGPSVVMLSGLPSSGKDYWAAQHLAELAMISPESTRVGSWHVPVASNGRGRPDASLELARDRARSLLTAGESIVWNASNLTRKGRTDSIRLFSEFGVNVRIVYVEVPYERLIEQNRNRRKRVPNRVLERMFERWEVPDRSEAHQVEWVVREGR